MVDLPAPVWPTSATVSPGRTTRFTPDSASCSCPEHLNRTSRNSTGPQLRHGREEQVDVEQVGAQPAGRQRLVMPLAGCDEQDEGPADGGQQLHEREVQRDQPLRPEPGPAVPGAQLSEMLLVAALAAVRLRGAQPGHVLLEVGVDE